MSMTLEMCYCQNPPADIFRDACVTYEIACNGVRHRYNNTNVTNPALDVRLRIMHGQKGYKIVSRGKFACSKEGEKLHEEFHANIIARVLHQNYLCRLTQTTQTYLYSNG